MSNSLIGVLGILALFGLLAIRMPVGIVMMLVGFVGIGVMNGWPAALSTLGGEPFVIASNFELMIIPMFVLMGNLASVSGMSRDLYRRRLCLVRPLAGRARLRDDSRLRGVRGAVGFFRRFRRDDGPRRPARDAPL